MPKGKPWSVDEERRLRELRSEGLKVSEIAVAMGKSEEAVMKKLQRLGLKVVQQRESNWTTSSPAAAEIIVPKELYSVEEALGMLAGAMRALQAPGLSKTEVMRLRSLIQAASVYQVKFAEYMDYRGIEKEVFELEKKYRDLIKREPMKDENSVEKPHEPVSEHLASEVGQGNNRPAEAAKEDGNSVEEKGNENQSPCSS